MAVIKKTRSMVVILGVLFLFVFGCAYGRGLTYTEGGTLMGALYGAGSVPLSARPPGTPVRERGSAAWWVRSSGAPSGTVSKATIDTDTRARITIPITIHIAIPIPITRTIGDTAAHRPLRIRIIDRIPRMMRDVPIRSPIRTKRTVKRIPPHRHTPKSITRNRIDG